MKIARLWLTILVALVGNQARGNLIRVYLQAGQSNADGRAESSGLPTTPVNLRQPQTDVEFFFRVEGSHPWENILIDLRPGSPEFNQANYFGPEITFGRGMADHYAFDPSTSVAILKYANGATNLRSHWRAGGTGETLGDGPEYVTFQNTVSAGLAAIQAANPTDAIMVSGVIWHQGEADTSNAANAGAYESNLTNFIADVRSTYGADLPFVIGEIADNGANYQIVRAAQAAVAAADPLNGFVDVDGFGLKSDHVHFNASGQQALGWNFSAQMLALPLPTNPHDDADFDGDGSVDGDDFLAWQCGFGQFSGGAAKMDGDANGDGFVDGDDFLVWQSQFGSGSSLAGTAVPEPGSAVLLLSVTIVGMLSLLRGNR